MICMKGSIQFDHEANVEQFGEDCDAMGSDPYPFYKNVISSYKSIHDRNRASSVRTYICRAVMMMIIMMMIFNDNVDLIVSYMKVLITLLFQIFDTNIIIKCIAGLLAYRRG